jgi:hypothetical protein
MVSLNDMADRTPRMLADGEVVDLGGDRRLRYMDTTHIPHGWEAGVLYEETTGTLLCGDLFAHLGDGAPLTDKDVVGPAIAAEDMFHASSLNLSNRFQFQPPFRVQSRPSWAAAGGLST